MRSVDAVISLVARPPASDVRQPWIVLEDRHETLTGPGRLDLDAPSAEDWTAIEVRGGSLTLEGWTIVGKRGAKYLAGLLVTRGGRLRLRDCDISGVDCIAHCEDAEVDVEDCGVSDVRRFAFMSVRCASHFRRVVAEDIGENGQHHFVYDKDTRRLIVEHCEFSRITGTAVNRYGGTVGGFVRVLHNDFHSCQGVYLDGVPTDAMVIGNTFTTQTNHVGLTSQASGVLIAQNRFACRNAAIMLQASGNADVRDVAIFDNEITMVNDNGGGSFGVMLEGRPDRKIERIRIHGNRWIRKADPSIYLWDTMKTAQYDRTDFPQGALYYEATGRWQ